MLVHVSYPYHAYLESRPTMKNSCWMKHGKTFCNIFVMDVHRKKIPGFTSKKNKQKTFDWFSHFKHVFVSYSSCLVQSIFKQKSLTVSWNLFQKEYQEKQDFWSWLDPCIQLKEKQSSLFYEIKIYKNEFLNASAFQWYQIINALNKIWFSHSDWPLHGIVRIVFVMFFGISRIKKNY